MVANDRKSYISYLNELLDQYYNTFYDFINKKAIDAFYSALT